MTSFVVVDAYLRRHSTPISKGSQDFWCNCGPPASWPSVPREDNDHGVVSGWRDSRLSERGRIQASELGVHRRGDGLQAVFTSDLGRAVETARIAFVQTSIPIFCDWRLRECDYGAWNGRPIAHIQGDRRRYLAEPYPGGESWQQAVHRVGRFLPYA
jgi:2,3-bisphosphoglycerate-dependent phosphoglycerate mutase